MPKVNLQSRQSLLLITVGFLLIIRFVLVPLNVHRHSLNDEYQAKIIQYQKGQALLASNVVLSENIEVLQSSLSNLSGMLPKANQRVQAQLNAQQQIRSLADNRNITLEQMEWLSIQEGTPELARLSINFEAEFKDLMFFFTELSSMGIWLHINDYAFRVNKQRVRYKRLGEAKGNIQLDVYYIVSNDELAQ